jgi:tRNA(Ile)-lysidine synthase
MPGPAPAVAAIRLAVREVLDGLPSGATVLVACSGGADSLALAAGVAFEAPRLGLSAAAVVVDHGLQGGSAAVAATAASQCRSLGLSPVEVVRVEVAPVGTGPEAAARTARYAALRATAARLGAAVTLLGHTRDDQAEQVLLGLTRGSGTRSLSGMPTARDGFARPLLSVTRAETETACREQGLTWWLDPHNADQSYTRVRARALLAEAERVLGPGGGGGRGPPPRAAAQGRADADLLDALADQARADLGPAPVQVGQLRGIPDALRRRVWLRLAADAGAGPLTATHVGALDALVTNWHGQGSVDLPGGVRAQRRDGRIWLPAHH